MTEVWFYHLERTGLEQALPELLEKTLQRGWKALVRAPEAERLEHLDSWLWTYRDESFLPHAPAADVLVVLFERGHDLRERDPVLEQAVGVDADLELLLVPAPRVDFRHAGHGFQLVAEMPVLK